MDPPGGRAGDSTVATTCSGIFVCGLLMTLTSHGRDFQVVNKPVPWPRGGRFVFIDYPEKTTHVTRDRPRVSSCVAYQLSTPYSTPESGQRLVGVASGSHGPLRRCTCREASPGRADCAPRARCSLFVGVTLALARPPASPVVKSSFARAEDGLSCGAQASVRLEDLARRPPLAVPRAAKVRNRVTRAKRRLPMPCVR